MNSVTVSEHHELVIDRVLGDDPFLDSLGQQSASSGRKLLYTEAELESLPMPPYLIDGYLPANGFGMVIGRKGSFKSFWGLDLGASVSCLSNWHGRPVQRATVVYIAAEGRAGIPRRLRAWRQRHGVDSTGVLIYPAPLQLLRPNSVEALAAELVRILPSEARTRPLLLLVDTKHRCTAGGKENEADTTALVLDTVEILRATFEMVIVLFFHHPARGGEEGRGSTSWEDDADVVFRIEREGKAMQITVTNTKQKDVEEAPPMVLELETEGDSLVIVPGAPEALVVDQRALTDGELASLKSLDDFKPEALTFSRWKDAAVANGVGPSTFPKHRTRLLTLGYVKQGGTDKRPTYSLTGEGVVAILPQSPGIKAVSFQSPDTEKQYLHSPPPLGGERETAIPERYAA